MAQKLNLNRFKSSGVYTVEIDESQNIALPLGTGRLVIGSSKRGPVNTVVALTDLNSALAVYGEKDLKLESKGSYFHRTLEVALRRGPVYALNVLPVDSDLDKVKFATFNTESASFSSDLTNEAFNQTLSKFYNTQKLWYADEAQFNRTKNNALSAEDDNKIFSIVNLGKRPVTVWAKLADVSGYDVTIKEYYKVTGGDKVTIPSYLNQDDIVADYIIELIAVEGDWTDNVRLANDPVYKNYFNERGLVMSKINGFLNLREIRQVARVTGSLIPQFKDASGNDISIDRVLNRLFSQTELFCALDENKIEEIDLASDTFANDEIMSQRIDLAGHGYSDLILATEQDYYIDNGYDSENSNFETANAKIDVLGYTMPTTNTAIYAITDGAQDSCRVQAENGNDIIVATEVSQLYKAWKQGFIVTGNALFADEASDLVSQYIKVESGFTETVNSTVYKYIKIKAYNDVLLTDQTDAAVFTYNLNDFIKISLDLYGTGGSVNKVFDFATEIVATDSGAGITTTTLAINKIQIRALSKTVDNSGSPITTLENVDYFKQITEFVKPNYYVKAKLDGTGRSRFMKIVSVAETSDIVIDGDITSTYRVLTVTTMVPSSKNVIGIDIDSTILFHKGIKNYVFSVKGVNLGGFTLRDAQLPNGTATRQHEILSYLYEMTNIAKTLAEGQAVDFRYIIDTYDGDISNQSKYYLAKMAADNGQCLAILNAPSFRQLELSTEPSFLDTTTQLVSAKHIATGGNLDLNPVTTFNFVDEEVNGVPMGSYAAYFMPNLIINDAGRNKSVPPAAYVANAFINKFDSGRPFSIVAGKNGIIADPDVQNIEYELSQEDRDYLEPAGFNMIVRRRGFGIMVFTNNTAYQKINSALNNTHVREALVTIEKDIERILFNFLFDFNDEITRLRIKTLVEGYLDRAKNAQGISSYRVVFDSTNNGNEVLSANSAIIDIFLDFPRGIHKFINRITITKTGGGLSSESTGFIPSF